ncbi:MAG: ferrous iron transporter B [Clostridia bacterium]|nr:ferrous iron transporter B [Clostridia bacterium]
MREIIFVGNPNAGKSTLFNALTGAHAHTGNWHGVTVGATSKLVKKENQAFLYTDLPGIYALTGYSMEEMHAIRYIQEKNNCLLVNVVDVRTLSRSLELTKSLVRTGVPVIVALTMCKRFQKQGGTIDVSALSQALGVPVCAVDAFSKSDVVRFNQIIQKSRLPFPKTGALDGFSLKGIYTPQIRKESLVESICYNRFACIPIFLLLTFAVFFLTFGECMPGTLCKNFLEELICERLTAFVANYLQTPAVCALVCDGFLRSAGSVLGFLPQIAILYSFLLFLEESGFMSALAFTADGVFSKLGLNGRAVFCILLGFGCTAQSILSTRGFEKKSMQERTILALPYISCSAKLPVYVTLLSSFFENPFLAVVGLYGLGVVISLGIFVLQSRGEMQNFILELPEMQLPNIKFFLKTLRFRLKQFIIKIVTVVTAFTLAVWFLSSFNFQFSYVPMQQSILAHLCEGLKYVFYPIGVYDWQTAFALLSGLIAKENVAGLLGLFYPQGFAFSSHTALALAVFILLCSPCISAIAASAREIGWKKSLFNALFQTVTAVFASYVTYYVLQAHVLILGVLLLLFILFIIKRICFERIYRRKSVQLKDVHR